jgi:hypothetical protein
MTLPDFIIIGAMKSGTSSLHRYLSDHPEIWASPREVDFFDTKANMSKGLDWYSQHFQRPEGIKVVGDRSTQYSKFPAKSGVPERIHSTLPNIKLIYIMRDPVERLVSHYMHNVADGLENRLLEDALLSLEDNEYLQYSLYFTQLEQYIPYFTLQDIHLLTLEQLHDKPYETMKSVFAFLNVDTTYSSSMFKAKFHQSKDKRYTTQFGKLFNRYIVETGISSVIRPYVPSNLVPTVLNAYHKYTTAPKIKDVYLSEKTKLELYKYFEPEILRLTSETGVSFENYTI